MLVFGIILLLIGVISLLTLAALEARDAYRNYRVEQARVERQKRIAERRLHDVSSKAFESMLETARDTSGSTDRPWWS